MSFIQRELDRISTALQSDPDDKDYDRLYAAQQALAWALDPLNFAHPMRVIKGLNWADIMDSAAGRSLDPLISYKADPASFPNTMKLVPRPKGSPNEFHAMDSPGWDNWQDGPGATAPANTTDDHIDPYGQNADRSSYTAEYIAAGCPAEGEGHAMISSARDHEARQKSFPSRHAVPQPNFAAALSEPPAS